LLECPFCGLEQPPDAARWDSEAMKQALLGGDDVEVLDRARELTG
jgi:hypothetical protein